MKIAINEGSVQHDELKAKLTAQFPQYQVKERTKNYLVVRKTGSIGCNVLIRRNKLIIAGNFPSIGGQMLFTLSFLLLGVLIPLIVYFSAFHGKFRTLEKEIAGYLGNVYGIAK